MNRRAFMVALTGSAVVKPVVKPIGYYAMTITDINYATKTVTFNCEWVDEPWPPPMPPIVLSFAPNDDKDKTKHRYLSAGISMDIL
jgi:hypothetical protein